MLNNEVIAPIGIGRETIGRDEHKPGSGWLPAAIHQIQISRIDLLRVVCQVENSRLSACAYTQHQSIRTQRAKVAKRANTHPNLPIFTVLRSLWELGSEIFHLMPKHIANHLGKPAINKVFVLTYFVIAKRRGRHHNLVSFRPASLAAIPYAGVRTMAPSQRAPMISAPSE